jgi:hypothetical protein
VNSIASSTSVTAYRRSPAVTIRWATPGDAASVQRLAQLDESSVPPGPLLLAFVGEELWVAASASSGVVVADPFRPSADVAALVLERGRQLTAVARRRPRRSALTVRLRRRAPAIG